MTAIDFYCDFISPYAYLGWTQIHALAARHNRTVTTHPVLFAAMLKHSGTLGPAEIPLKRAYIYKNAIRIARDLGVPFTAPPHHPFNPLAALRVATAAGGAREIVDVLFHAAWGNGHGIEDLEGLVDETLLAAANAPETKQRLREETGAAIDAGVFGVPTVIADGELFWGTDSFGHLERFLRGEDTITADDAARFASLVPSATRPR